MIKQKHTLQYFVRGGEFKGIAGQSLFPEVEAYFKKTIEAFKEDAKKEQEKNPEQNYTGRLEITIEEN